MSKKDFALAHPSLQHGGCTLWSIHAENLEHSIGWVLSVQLFAWKTTCGSATLHCHDKDLCRKHF